MRGFLSLWIKPLYTGKNTIEIEEDGRIKRRRLKLTLMSHGQPRVHRELRHAHVEIARSGAHSKISRQSRSSESGVRSRRRSSSAKTRRFCESSSKASVCAYLHMRAYVCMHVRQCMRIHTYI
eukprot:2255888-Pleurochrysis_carterae.AAC.4